VDPYILGFLAIVIVSLLLTEFLVGDWKQFFAGIHVGTFIVLCAGAVVVFFILLHTFSDSFRQSFNSAFSDWWADVPILNVVVLVLLLLGFVAWAVRTVVKP